MRTNPLNHFAGHEGTTRERRLCAMTQTPFEPDKSPIVRGKEQLESQLNNQIQRWTRPQQYKQRQQSEALSDPARQMAAFADPEVFTARQNPNALQETGDDNIRMLLTLPADQRLGRLQQFINERIPPQVQMRYPQLFGAPLGQNDIQALQSNQGGRIVTIQTVFSLLAGQASQAESDPVAWNIARETLEARNSQGLQNSQLYGAFDRWMRETSPTPTEVQATNTEFLLSYGNLPVELRGAIRLGFIDTNRLKGMYDIYRGIATDTRLQALDQRKEYMKMAGSVAEREYEMQTSNMVDNFRTLQPWQQWAIIGLGGYLLYKGVKSKNPLIQWPTIALVGYYAYDRIINGNENALADMGGKFKAGVNFSKDRVKQAAEYFGINMPKNERDRLLAMGRFLERHQLDIAPAATGMAAMAEVPFTTILDAYAPNENDIIGGSLAVNESPYSSGKTSFVSIEKGGNPGGRALGKALNNIADRKGITASEKRAMFEYLHNHNAHMGKAIAHMLYLVAAEEPENIQTVRAIQQAMEQQGMRGDYSALPQNLRVKYQQMVIQGATLARMKHGNKNLYQLIAVLNPPVENRPGQRPETSARIPDPETSNRSAEFKLYRKIRGKSLSDRESFNELTDNNREVERDFKQFTANMLEAGTLTDESAANRLNEKFEQVMLAANRGMPLSEVLQTIETIKYSVLIAGARGRKALSADDIETMAGPNGSTPARIISSATSFLRARNIPVPGGINAVTSLSDVQALLTVPLIGRGPLDANGKNFDRLKNKVSIYQQRFNGFTDYEALATRALDHISTKNPSIIADLGMRDAAKQFILDSFKTRVYEDRVKRTNQYFSQKLAVSLLAAQTMRHGMEGKNRFEATDQRISPNEQFNLEREFDRLYEEIVGNLENGPGMWQKVEDYKTMYEMVDTNNLDLKTSANREQAVANAVDIGTLFMLRLFPRPQMAPGEQQALRDHVQTIKDKLADQFQADMIAAGVPRETFNDDWLKEAGWTVADWIKWVHDKTNSKTWDERQMLAIRNEYEIYIDKKVNNVLKLLEADVPPTVVEIETSFGNTGELATGNKGELSSGNIGEPPTGNSGELEIGRIGSAEGNSGEFSYRTGNTGELPIGSGGSPAGSTDDIAWSGGNIGELPTGGNSGITGNTGDPGYDLGSSDELPSGIINNASGNRAELAYRTGNTSGLPRGSADNPSGNLGSYEFSTGNISELSPGSLIGLPGNTGEFVTNPGNTGELPDGRQDWNAGNMNELNYGTGNTSDLSSSGNINRLAGNTGDLYAEQNMQSGNTDELPGGYTGNPGGTADDIRLGTGNTAELPEGSVGNTPGNIGNPEYGSGNRNNIPTGRPGGTTGNTGDIPLEQGNTGDII